MTDGSFVRHTRRRVANVTATMLGVLALVGVVGGLVSPAYAQAPWSALPGSCASTDNNFYNGTPSNDYPVARFRVPGGSIAFNGFHDGYIAVICSVDNPRNAGTVFSRWNQLQVTYRDPDGMGLPGQKGSEYQAYVELVRVSKTTGTWEKITSPAPSPGRSRRPPLSRSREIAPVLDLCSPEPFRMGLAAGRR
jgi:hypothetical protein